ncbi:MAG: DUF86 domain-containing protein [Segatella copri]
MYNRSTIHDKLEEIKESIELIQEWSKDVESADDFMLSPTKYMAFNACVMRLQVIGEHVGKLLKVEEKPLEAYPNIPWQAIYGMRNMISHEYANVDETIVYDTIKNELPELKNIIEDLLSQY